MTKQIKVLMSILIICSICLFTLSGCMPSEGFLNSITEIELYNGNTKAAGKEIYSFLEDFENITSVNVKGSDVEKINNAKANEKVEVSDCVIDLINISKMVFNQTGGAFNPCIYPVLSLYNFGKRIVPSDEAIIELLPFTDINDLTVNGNFVMKKYSETQIDLGAIAKGYAADKCVEIAKKHGVTSGLINLGGNLYIIGAKSGGVPFEVGITNPRDDGSYLFGTINLSEISAATSGDYERFFILNGIRYCHIIDGVTGKRADSNLISATIFGKNSTLCDAYSTALFVMGMEKATEFAKNNLKDFKILLIDENRKYYKSEGLDIYDIDSLYSAYKVL